MHITQHTRSVMMALVTTIFVGLFLSISPVSADTQSAECATEIDALSLAELELENAQYEVRSRSRIVQTDQQDEENNTLARIGVRALDAACGFIGFNPNSPVEAAASVQQARALDDLTTSWIHRSMRASFRIAGQALARLTGLPVTLACTASNAETPDAVDAINNMSAQYDASRASLVTAQERLDTAARRLSDARRDVRTCEEEQQQLEEQQSQNDMSVEDDSINEQDTTNDNNQNNQPQDEEEECGSEFDNIDVQGAPGGCG